MWGEKKKQKEILKIIWDTETYRTRDTDGEIILRPYLIGWYCEDQFYYSYEPHTLFFDFLVQKAKKYILHLWCFNANFDLPVIFPEYLSTYCEDSSTKYRVSKNKQFISFVYKSDKLTFKVFDAAVWNVHFRSLNDWFKLIGIEPKKQFSPDKWDLERRPDCFVFNNSEGVRCSTTIKEELEYLRWDCVGTSKVVEYQQKSRDYLYKLLGLNDSYTQSTTAPSFSKKLINSVFVYENFDVSYREKTEIREFYQMMLASSCGGFTACNKSQNMFISDIALIASYDVNSMYPYILTLGIPKGAISDKKKWKNYCTWYEINLTECEWVEVISYISTPALPSRWCNLKHNVFLLKEYYEVIKNHIKTDLKIVKIWFQELDYKLKPLILKLVDEKVKISKKPPSVEKNFEKENIKLLLNAIYGKLAEQTYEEEHFYDPVVKNFMSYPDEQKKFSYTLSGAYVVQMARAYLIHTLLSEIKRGNTFLYCDTDSLKFIENTPVKLKIDQHKLGYFKNEKWHPEKGYTHFFTTGKIKKYLMYHKDHRESFKVVLSGVSNKVKDLINKYATEEQINLLYNDKFNVMIKGGKLSRDRNKWGQLTLLPIDICLNGFLKKHTHEMSWDPKEKKWTINQV